jgi:predicted amidohydrolase
MSTIRISLANIPYPETPDESIAHAEQAIAQAALAHADIICFPECYVPGYRGLGKTPPPPDPARLNRAWSNIATAARQANVAVVLGTERIVEGALRISATITLQR